LELVEIVSYFKVTSTALEAEAESLESPRYLAVMAYLPAG
jgi:hypothetical protein